ncbi:2OG-Fe(II) oxygenase [Acrocarpospora catenulata]|uniref:2OG-Fe(II) oxygenase n=1 Tax=Acrocarpospora catenulata TaxID=2836182 RepID=UPI001BDA9150|nr:2OG-Fe(II) oxygenase [Acrocarpospora catenulata]
MTETTRLAGPVAGRVAQTDWAALAAELNEHGNALTGQLIIPAECRELTALYDQPDRFRTTVDMARHRFGSGQYRYFTTRDRPVATKRGWSNGPMRHGVSTVRSGHYVTHRVFFADEPTAVAAGYRPCAVCLPADYAHWKVNRESTTR